VRGDCVTFSGSVWIANAETTARPGTEQGAATWTLAVKRGDKGPTGPAGPRGAPGARGEQGMPGGRY
jgi:collagen type III alpha